MKNIRFWQFIIFFILFSVTSKAQNYQPFSKNSYVYNFVGTDEYYKLTVDSVTIFGNDSVFHFNPIAHNYSENRGTFNINNNNIFGRMVIKKPNGDYYFLVFNDSLLIKTKVGNNFSWIFSKSKNITATLKNKTFEDVFGQKDSVISILLSTGDIIKISQNFGLIEGKIFIRQPLININYDVVESIPDTTLILESIPIIKMGLNYPGFADFFNFEAGDVFGYESKSDEWGPVDLRWEEYTLNKIISRETNKNQDSVKLKYEHKYFENKYVHPNTYITTRNKIETTIYTKSDYLLLESNSLFFVNEGSQGINFLSTIKYSYVQKRFILNFSFLFLDKSDSTLRIIMDAGGSQVFTQRLGRTEFYGNGYDNLVCYSINNGTETWGKCPDLDKMLSVEENAVPQPTFQISPNPANNEITLKATLKNNNQNSKDLIKITDIQGEVVNQQIINSATINQNEEIKIDISSLQNGLYLLHFISGSGNVYSQKFIISK